MLKEESKAEKQETDDKDETENAEATDDHLETITLGVQHRGKISNKEATRILRKFWPKYVVKSIAVKRRVDIVDVFPDYKPIWVMLTLARGYTFESYLDWPANEENWPEGFDKGLFKDEGDWC